MTPERWQRAKEIFQQALDLPVTERAVFVSEATADDETIRAEVESLLTAHDREDGFSLATDRLPGNAEVTAAATLRMPMRCPKCNLRYGDGATACSHDGELLVDDPGDLIGTTLDETYRIVGLLGRGGMGVVYLAEHVLLHDRVAIKVLPDAATAHAESFRRFLREGRMARAIRHPNVVSVLELRTSADGVTYMVMEYVEGRTLREDLRARGRLSLDEAMQILEPIASALDHAHSLGIVHRDLKPENVIIGGAAGEPLVKLLDLGLARLFESSEADGAATNVTSAGQAIGTPIYMPPEQWGQLPEDGGSDIDARADIYSLGVMLFEMVSGRRPFEGSSANALRIAHSRELPPALTGLVPDLPQSASDAIARALAKDRSGRQASAGELLAEVRAGVPASAVPAPAVPAPAVPAPPSTPAPARSRLLWTLARLAVVAVGAAVGVAATIILGLAVAGKLWAPPDVPDPASESRPAAAPSVDERTLRLALEAQRTRGGVTTIEPFLPTSELAFGDGDGVRVEATSSHEGFLYILNEGPTLDAKTALPRYTVIFPKPEVNGGSPHVAANGAVRVPDATWIEFFGAGGRETFWVIWSAKPIEPLGDVAQLVTRQRKGRVSDPTQVEAIRRFLVSRANPEIRVAEDPDAGTRIATSGDVIVFPLYLEHR